ncbi:hypothetical protein UFOVP224_1, partial [uncultured Caudovirales phage]
MIKNHTKSKRGGLRPGAGRPAGSRTKSSWADLLNEFERQMNQGFVTTVVENYLLARERQDWAQVCVYDRAILNKLAPDLYHVEIEDNSVETKRLAFAEALADMT